MLSTLAHHEERDLLMVRRVRAALYSLIQEKSQDPALLKYIREVGEQWLQHVANGGQGFSELTEDPRTLRAAAVAFIKTWTPSEEETQEEIRTKLNWKERVLAVFVIRAHQRTLSKLRAVVEKL